MKRREFIKKGILLTTPLLMSNTLLAESLKAESHLTIMHTNDTHSRLDPFPEGSGYRSGMGGVAMRATLIKKLRAENPNNLLLDAGDAFQGTPYFNFYEGRLEYETMSMLGYDYTTLGNHEFDLGTEGLLKAMDFLNFKVISSNCKSKLPKFNKHVLSNEIIVKDGVKIGIFGLTVDFKGLVSPDSYKGIERTDSVETAKEEIKYLKSKNVDYIILLSHLGIEDDEKLVKVVDGIDLIVGGHSHTKIEQPIKSKNGTLILQAASSGIFLGKLDLHFKDKKLDSYNYRLIPVK